MAVLRQEYRLRVAWSIGLAAALATIAAQFIDYTGFQIGTGGVESANAVAPRPLELTATPGADQLWIGVPLGLAALLALRLAALGQWRLGRAIAMIGVVMLALTLIVLLPNATDGSAGGDVGDVAAIYAGASERLLTGFWLQLGGAIGLIVSGVTMAIRPPSLKAASARAHGGAGA